MFADLGETSLLGSDSHFGVEGLSIHKVGHVPVEVHPGEALGEDIEVAFERKSDQNGTLIREDLGQD